MKILHVKFNGVLNEKTKERILGEINRSLQHGVLFHDDNLAVEVLEFDEVKVDCNFESEESEYLCLDCKREFKGNPIKCPDCWGPIIPHMKEKIVIELTDANTPPRVTVDGEKVKVISLDYHYETSTHEGTGENIFNLVIPDVVDGKFQTKGIAFDRNMK